MGRANSNNHHTRIFRNMLQLITYLRTGRRTQREITEHMGWKPGPWNKTARRYMRALEECGVPICEDISEGGNLRPGGRDPSIYWIDRRWKF